MVNLYVSYRSQDRSRVREIEAELKKCGLCHEFIDDIDDGDLRQRGFDYYWENLLKPKLNGCHGLVLLIGDTTHSPRQALLREIKFAKSRSWYVFGIYLTLRTGSPPEEVSTYKKFIPLDYEPADIVSQITQVIPCS